MQCRLMWRRHTRHRTPCKWQRPLGGNDFTVIRRSLLALSSWLAGWLAAYARKQIIHYSHSSVRAHTKITLGKCKTFFCVSRLFFCSRADVRTEWWRPPQTNYDDADDDDDTRQRQRRQLRQRLRRKIMSLLNVSLCALKALRLSVL